MRKTGVRLSVAVLALLAAAASVAWALDLGDKAPELDVSAWVQGGPVKFEGNAGKNVFVVEFVQTFKPDSQKALASAVKLKEKHKAKGLEVIAVSIESEAEVKAWLAENKTDVVFAVDENHNAIAEYLGENPTFPVAVVIDRAGVVVFTGDPTDGMDKLVDDVIAGKFDPKKALEVRALRTELREAWNAQEYDKADLVADKILALDVTDWQAFSRRCDGFERRENLDGYRKFVKSYSERVKDDAGSLSRVAWRLVFDNRLNWRDPDLALVSARRAVELSKNADADAIDTYAQVLAEVGLLDQAIAAQKKAVELEPENKSYKNRLAFLESCVALREKQRGPPPGPKKK